MLILSSTSDKVQVGLLAGGNVTVHASYLDNVAGAVNPQRKNTLITTTALTDIVASPPASVQRNVKTMHIHNNGAAAVGVSVLLTDGTTAVTLAQQTLAPNATLQYIDEIGFVLSDFAERMPVINLTANYTVGFFDRNAIININTTPITLSLLAASTAGAGFVFRVRNTTMGTATIDPNASETIDGKATIPCCAKEEFLIACDGTNWITLGRDSLVMIASGVGVTGATFSTALPPDYTKFEIEMAQIVYGTPGFIGLNINFAGPWGTYYIQRHYSFGTTIAADQGIGLGASPVQFSGNSSVPKPDFDATLDLWPDPMVAPRTSSFHFTSRTTMLNDGTSAIIDAGGWAIGSTRATQVMFGSTGGPFEQGRFTMRGQRP